MSIFTYLYYIVRWRCIRQYCKNANSSQISYHCDLNCIKRISVSMFQTNDMMHEQQIEEGEIKMFCQFREWRMKRVKDEES